MTRRELPGFAHETGELTPGTWVCDCDECSALIAAADSFRSFIINGETGRARVLAKNIVANGVDALAATAGIGYVRAVWASL